MSANLLLRRFENEQKSFTKCKRFVNTSVGLNRPEARWKWGPLVKLMAHGLPGGDAAGHTNRRFGSTPEPAAAPTRRHDWRREYSLRVSSPSTATSPHKSRQESFAARSRGPYRSRLKQSAAIVSRTLQFVSPHLAAPAAEEEQGGWRRTGPPTGTACSSGASPTETAPNRRVLSGLRPPRSDPLLPPFALVLCHNPNDSVFISSYA